MRRIEERNQQRILALCQRDRLAAGIGEAPVAPVQLPVAEAAAAFLAVALGRSLAGFAPSQHRANAGEQFPQAERLGDVIVGAQFQPDDAIDLVAAMTRGDDDGNVGLRANLAQEIEAVLLPEPEIEDHEIRLAAGEQARDLIATRRGDGADVVVLEIIRHEVPHGAVILDHETGRRFAIGAMARQRTEPGDA